jgi:hypothetical protein
LFLEFSVFLSAQAEIDGFTLSSGKSEKQNPNNPVDPV